MAEDVLLKYRKLYEGVNPEKLRTLKRAREIAAQLRAESFSVNGIYGNTTSSGAVVAEIVPEDALVLDGFPEDKPILLTIRGDREHHGVAEIDKQMSYGWGYWTFFGKWVLRMWW